MQMRLGRLLRQNAAVAQVARSYTQAESEKLARNMLEIEAQGNATRRDCVVLSERFQKETAMFCSGCGQALAPGQAICSQCGRPISAPVPPVPGLEFQLESYAGKVKALSIVWFIYAAFALVTGVIGLVFANAFLSGRFGPFVHGPWMHGPWGYGPFPPEFFGPALLHLVWIFLVVRAGLALVVGWGLLERTQWGRIVAIVAAFLSLLKFPFGTALGIWTLVTLMGYRNATLYERL